MDEILNKIEQLAKDHAFPADNYGLGYHKALDDIKAIILVKQKESCEEYIQWLENMTILLAGCYQQTHDMLLLKAKEGNKAYFEMPTVQGFEMVMMVNKISKLKPNGTVDSGKLEGFTNWLIEQYMPTQSPRGNA